MQQVATHNVRINPFDERQQGFHGATAPADECAFGNVGPHALKYLVLAIEGKMIVELRDQHMR
jgi:hypothetical protein